MGFVTLAARAGVPAGFQRALHFAGSTKLPAEAREGYFDLVLRYLAGQAADGRAQHPASYLGPAARLCLATELHLLLVRHRRAIDHCLFSRRHLGYHV